MFFNLLAATEETASFSFTALMVTIGNWLVTTGLKVVLALLVFFILCKVINFITKKFDKFLEKKKVDKTLRVFISSWSRKILKVLLFVLMIGFLGVQTSAVSAAIASVGVTIGLALQGSLSNIAGGIIIVVLHPFRLDDYISANGVEGTVTQIDMFYTYILTPDNKEIVLPNGSLANSVITNVNTKDTRRLDLEFTIDYSANSDKAIELIKQCLTDSNLTLSDPAPLVTIKEHADSSIVILCRFWTKTSDYWAAKWYMMDNVKKSFDENSISIPFPQLDVHLKQN